MPACRRRRRRHRHAINCPRRPLPVAPLGPATRRLVARPCALPPPSSSSHGRHCPRTEARISAAARRPSFAPLASSRGRRSGTKRHHESPRHSSVLSSRGADSCLQRVNPRSQTALRKLTEAPSPPPPFSIPRSEAWKPPPASWFQQHLVTRVARGQCSRGVVTLPATRPSGRQLSAAAAEGRRTSRRVFIQGPPPRIIDLFARSSTRPRQLGHSTPCRDPARPSHPRSTVRARARRLPDAHTDGP